MITTKYFDFFNQYKIFEATEEEITDIAVNFLFKEIYGKRALASLKSKIKKEKLEEAGITEEEFQGFIDSLKGLSKEQVAEKIASSTTYSTLQEIRDILKNTQLSENQISAAKARAKKDPYFLRLKHLFTKADLPYEWLEAFLRLFYSHFKNYKVNTDPTDPNGDYDKITDFFGPYTYSDDQIKWVSEYGPYGSFGDIYNKIAILPGDNNNKAQKDILGKFISYIKFEKDKQNSNSDDLSTGFEKLKEDVNDLSKKLNIETLAKRLPRGYCVDESNNEIKDSNGKRIQDSNACSLKGGNIKYNVYEEYEKLKDDDQLKKSVNSAIESYIEILKENDIPIKPVIELVNGKETPVYKYEVLFPIRRGTADNNYQNYKTLEDFRKQLVEYINSYYGNSDVGLLVKKVIEVNKKYGENRGVEIIYNKDNKAVIWVKTHEANRLLHNEQTGILTKTQHCLAWTGDTQWEVRLGNHPGYEDNTANKLYYIYNYNLPKTSALLPFGVIIMPNGNVASAYDKKDANGAGIPRLSMTQTQVQQHMRDFGIPFSVLAPITQEELSLLNRTRDITKIIIQKNISLDDIKFCVEGGVDINRSQGQALKNAIEEKHTEKITYLLEHGANIKLLQRIELTKLIKLSMPTDTNDIPAKIALIKNILNADSTFEDYAMLNAVTEWSLNNNNFNFFKSIADYYNASSFSTEDIKKELTHMIEKFSEFDGKIDKQFLNWLANRIKLFCVNNDVRLNKYKKYLITHFDKEDLTYINELLK